MAAGVPTTSEGLTLTTPVLETLNLTIGTGAEVFVDVATAVLLIAVVVFISLRMSA